MSMRLPDRWLPYDAIGKRIEGTPFIAFKVPLDQKFFDNKEVEEKERFTPETLIQMIPNLGLVIDLTATTRYYDPKFFSTNGIQHKKILTRGQTVPDRYNIREFEKAVTNFTKDVSNTTPDVEKLIGVHCTHGINRTGFLICSYMVNNLKMRPDEAITRFNEGRGHKIERPNYIVALKYINKRSSSPNSVNDNPSNNESSYPRIKQRHRIAHRQNRNVRDHDGSRISHYDQQHQQPNPNWSIRGSTVDGVQGEGHHSNYGNYRNDRTNNRNDDHRRINQEPYSRPYDRSRFVYNRNAATTSNGSRHDGNHEQYSNWRIRRNDSETTEESRSTQRYIFLYFVLMGGSILFSYMLVKAYVLWNN